MKKWKQLLVTGLLSVTMTLSAFPIYADEQTSTSSTSESTVQTDSTAMDSTDKAGSDAVSTDPASTDTVSTDAENTSSTSEDTSTISAPAAADSSSFDAEEPSADDAQPEVSTESVAATETTHNPTISYDVQVQNKGWIGTYSNGQAGGTSGEHLRMEAMKVYLNSDGADLGIQYRAHVQNIGWESAWHTSGQQAGTTGQALRMEAVQMQLTGADAVNYNLYFRVHVQNIGWMGWAVATGGNSAIAGTSGASYRIEAIQIVLVKAGDAAPSTDGQITSAAYLPADDFTYQAHVQNIGWQNSVWSGQTAGTTGRSLRVEALRISTNSPSVIGFQYRAQIQNIGWENTWHNTGDFSGTTGRGLRMEAVQIRLTGEMSRFFDVYYRVHAQNFGWMGWAKNGESAGTETLSLRMEGIQIVVRPKGAGAPSGGGAAFVNWVDPYTDMNAKAQGYSSSSRYLILVNKSSHTLSVYTGSKGRWTRNNSWKVDVGAPGMSTPSGVFHMGSKLVYFDSGSCRCWYASQVYNGIFFHSVLYYQTSSPTRIMDGRLGMSISHGCIRMALNNAKWIWDNVPSGTTVVIY
ncbi:MAG: L,D-transpeptidase family protein [Bilifractor sp.]